MYFRIAKRFSFSASHQLDHLPEGHKCARLHGHNYQVQVILRCVDVDHDGFVRDYGELQIVKDFLDSAWDHRHLNDILGSGIATTAENLAKFLFDRFQAALPELEVVGVSETVNTWAEYYG